MGSDEEIGKELFACVKDGLRKAVAEKLNGYGSPLEKMLNGCIEKHGEQLRSMLVDAISSAIGDAEFREQIATAMRLKLAKVLIERFGGELEKQVNLLKSDPNTRARITLAIDDILKSSK